MKLKIFIIFSIVLVILIIFGLICFGRNFIQKNLEMKIENLQEETTENEMEKEESVVVELPKKEDATIHMSMIGDIMCHNSQYVDAYDSAKGTYDFSYVFENIKEPIASADIAIGNLETTFAGKERGYSNYPQFNTPEQLAFNLKEVGIDVLSTANNHCMDTDYAGLVSTLNFLDEAGISHVGTSRSMEEQNTILVKEVEGLKIAFLSYTYDTNGITVPLDKSYAVNLMDENFIKGQIDVAKKLKPDLICASMHWGIEYQNQQNATQENLANFLFQNGVDIILGSHPHVLQPMERRSVVLENGEVKDCFVIYSLGNFMSAQTKENTKTSIILNLQITKKGDSDKIVIDSISYVPIYMYKTYNGGKKYQLLDIEKSIANYETGIDQSIGQGNYTVLKNEFERVKNLMGQW